MLKINKYTNISLFLLGISFFLFLFSPASANYSLIALVGWLLVGLYYKAIPSDFKNIYIYGVSALFFVFTISISRSEVWNSFAIFIPFLIPLLVFFITISLQVVDYSKGLLFLCGLYLALYAHQIFLTTPIIFIPDIPLNDFFSILLVFLPIFLTGIFKRKMPYSIFWKPIHILFSICLFLILFSSFEIIIWLLLLFTLLLMLAPAMDRFGFTTLLSFWGIVFIVFLVWDHINLSGSLHDDITGLFNLWKFDFISNFSWFGMGEWTLAGKNTYQQFYLSFGFFGLFFFLLLIAGFFIAVSSTVIRQYARNKDENHTLWGFFSSVILFLLLCTFKKNFVSLPVFYLVMGFWGLASGFINLVRGLKKTRV